MRDSLKHIILIFCCSLIANFSTAQFNQVIAYTPKTQVIFIGVDNPILVSLGAYKLSEVNIKVSEGFIRNDKIDGKYLWKICNTKSDSVFLSIYCNKVFVKRFKYETKEIQYPRVYFDCCSVICCDGVKSLTGNTNGLVVDFGDATIVPQSKITSYSVEFLDTTGKSLKYLFNNGARFTKTVKNQIELLRTNEGISIYNIKLQVGCESEPRILPVRIKTTLQN